LTCGDIPGNGNGNDMVKNLFNDRFQVAETFSQGERLVAVCDDALACAKSLPANFFSLIITSPPYNLGKEYTSIG
jgi:adenine-specific DNA-methyltransferase